MKTFNYIATWLLGAAAIFFGLNGFFMFMSGEAPANLAPLMEGLASTKYLFPFMNVTFIVSGLLLLIGRAVPFALVLLAPISINIILVHVFLAPSSILFGAIFAALNLYLAIVKFDAYKPMFK